MNGQSCAFVALSLYWACCIPRCKTLDIVPFETLPGAQTNNIIACLTFAISLSVLVFVLVIGFTFVILKHSKYAPLKQSLLQLQANIFQGAFCILYFLQLQSNICRGAFRGWNKQTSLKVHLGDLQLRQRHL